MVVRELIALLGFKTDEQSLKKAESSIGGLKKAAISLSAVLLSGAVVAGFNKLISLASESTETLNKFGAVFGSASEAVQKQLDETSKRTGVASLQLQQFAANIGAIVRPALGSAKAAGDMGARVAELALDIASFNDLEPEVALDKLRSGLVGATKPLQDVGVNLKKNNLEQSAYFKSLGKTIENLTQAELIQVRFNSTIEQLISQNALGDATRTALDFANASRALATQIKQLGATLGGFLLKDAGRTVAIYTKIVAATSAWIEANKDLIQQRVDDVLQVINNVIEGIVSTLRFIVSGWLQFAKVLGPVAGNLLIVTTILLALIAILGAPVVLLLAIGAAIAGVIDDLVVFARGGESVFGRLVDAVKAFAEEAGIDLDEFFVLFTDVWDLVVIAAGEMFDEIKEFFGIGEGDAEEFVESLKEFFKDGFKDISGFIKEALQTMKDFFKDTGEEGEGLFEGLGKKLLKFVRSIAGGPLGKAILTAVGVAAGAGLAGKIAETLNLGAATSAALLLAGGAGGALLGRGLSSALGGGGELPIPPAVAGGGGATITNGGTEMNFNISGAGSPEQVATEVGKVVTQEQERLHRRTMNQVTTAGAT